MRKRYPRLAAVVWDISIMNQLGKQTVITLYLNLIFITPQE